MISIEEIKNSFTDDVLYEIDKQISKPTFCLNLSQSDDKQKQIEALNTVSELYNQREKLKLCCLCHHSELLISEWINSTLCTGCYKIRNNKKRVEAILRKN